MYVQNNFHSNPFTQQFIYKQKKKNTSIEDREALNVNEN